MIHAFKTLIVEDTPRDLDILTDELRMHPEIFDIRKAATTYLQAIKILASEEFDLSIIDNRLDGGKDVLDLLKSVERTKFGIIAVTSIVKEELSIKGLQIRRPILIPKPHSKDVITHFIARLLDERKFINDRNARRFPVSIKGVSTPVLYDSIFFIRGDGKMTKVCFECSIDIDKKGYTMVSHDEGIGEVERRLDNSMFFRCQKSYIVNINRIRKCKVVSREIEILFRDSDTFLNADKDVIAFASGRGMEVLRALNFIK
ncbi:MAG: response regulator transcription factor [Chitinophagaceae bacterium]|nr:response regulator transcription factor [Chitinophagaceae bacterium]